MNPNFLLAHRNRYLEGIDDEQMPPRGFPTFNSYIKNLHFFLFQTEGGTNKWTDRQTEKLIR